MGSQVLKARSTSTDDGGMTFHWSTGEPVTRRSITSQKRCIL